MFLFGETSTYDKELWNPIQQYYVYKIKVMGNTMILYDTKYFKVLHIVVYVLQNYCNALITAFWY